MSRGDLLALAAMKKGLASLEAKAEKARKAVDACMSAPTDLCELWRESGRLLAAVTSKDATKAKKVEALAALEALADREKALKRVAKQDLVKLLDKQVAAEWDARDMRDRIQSEEFRLRMRGVLNSEVPG